MPENPTILDDFARELTVSRQIVKALDKLPSAEARARVLKTVADVYGHQITEKPKGEGQ